MGIIGVVRFLWGLSMVVCDSEGSNRHDCWSLSLRRALFKMSERR